MCHLPGAHGVWFHAVVIRERAARLWRFAYGLALALFFGLLILAVLFSGRSDFN